MLSDRRGAQPVEYLLIAGATSLVVLAAVRYLGSSIRHKAEQQAACVLDLVGCEDGPYAAAAPPAPRGTAVARVGVPPESRPGASIELAREIVEPGGSGTEEDAEIVAQELAKLPPEVLEYIRDKGITVVAAKESVTDYLTDLEGVRPRGWPPGSTWDSVPGVARGKVVVIATRDGRVPPSGDGHGCYNLLFHETFHAIDDVDGELDGDFATARKADQGNLSKYLRQKGDAGLEETFAETASRYYADDPALEKDLPNLYEYWETHDDDLFATRTP